MINLKKIINGYKKIIIVFVVMLLFGISVCAATENGLFSNSSDENPLDSFEYSEITFTDNNGVSSGFTYNDGMMLTDANELSSDLAKVSVCLADAAYKESAVKGCISDMKYELVGETPYNYRKTATYEDNDFVAYSIAHKVISYKEETYNSYLVIVRGTTGNCEWFSNFHLGNRSDGYHDGFKKAANEILTTISNSVTTSNNIFLVTGHSRGAAVANIVAGELTTNSKYNSLASQNHVFGYTFACPAVSDQLTSSDLELNNIRNYNNPGDAIPELPLEDWGYSRYGRSLDLSTDKDIYKNFKQRFVAEDDETYGGILHTDSFVSTLKTIADEKSAYNNADNQLLFDIAGWYLGGKSNASIQEVLSHHNVPVVLATALINITSDMLVSGIQDSIDSNYQDNLDFLVLIDSALVNTVNLSDDEFNSWCSLNQTLLRRISTEIEVDVKTRNDLVSARTKLEDGMDDVAYTTTNLATILSLWYSTNGKPIDAIFHAHTPETYVLWINSMFYGYEGWKGNNDIISFELPEDYYQIGVRCFYDCDNLSKVVLNDKVKYLPSGTFSTNTSLTYVQIPVDFMKYQSSTFSNSPISTIHYTVGKTGVMPDRSNNRSDDNYYVNTLEYGARSTLKTVTYDEGITRIGAYAYYTGNSSSTADGNITGLELPSTLESIGIYAFAYQLKGTLGKVVFPEGMKTIEGSAFYESSSLTGISLPSTLETIGGDAFYKSGISGKVALDMETLSVGSNAFYRCSGITELEISISDIKFGTNVFDKCSRMKKVTVPVDLAYPDGSSFGTTGAEEIHYTVGKTGVMPDRSKSGYDDNYYADTLEYGARSTLKTVKYDEGITRIGAYAYYTGDNSSTADGNITGLELPSTLESIGIYAFAYQRKGTLGKVVFPEGMKTIEGSAFYESSSLTGISLPSTLETIGGYAFYDSGINGKVTLDMKALSVSNGAFVRCSGITELEISESDIKFGTNVFDKCSRMKKVTVPVDLAYPDGSSFGTTGAEEIHYTVGKTGVMPDRSKGSSDDNYYADTLEYGARSTLKTVKYDEGITRIGDYAYYSNTALTDVLFAKSVDSIGINCFHSLTKANVKFYGHKDSYAETYSNDIGVDFVPLFYPIITTETNEFLTGAGYTFEARTYSGVDQYTTDVSWSINGQNSDKTVIDENGLLKIAGDESADSITVIADNGTNKSTFEAKIKQHTHEYSSEPTFHWVDDYTACDAVVKCQICGSEKRYTCTVTKTSVPSSCSKEGKITYTANVTLSDREYTDIKEVSQDRLEHSVVKIEGYDPTCTEAGLTEGSYCSECGEVIKEQTSIDAIGHDLEKVDAVEPTEELTGNIEYYICNVCGHIFKDANATEETSLEEVIIPAYGESHEHNWIEIMRQEPTCIASGLVTYVCQCSEKKEEMLDPLEHHIQVDDAVPATCTETGLTEGSHCSVCNTVLKAQKEIAAKGHTYKDVITRATLSSNGKIVKKCSKCGEVKSTTTIYRPTKFTLSTTAYTYNGGIKKPTVTVKNSAGKTLVKDTDYTLIYASGRKYVGKYSVKITFKGKYSGSKTLYFKINPPKTSLTSLTASSRGFTAKWSKKTTQVTGYQVQYSTSSKFTNPKTVTITKNATTYKKITKLTAKKKYYVRVRTYKTVNSVKYYSSWSSYKYVTTKS